MMQYDEADSNVLPLRKTFPYKQNGAIIKRMVKHYLIQQERKTELLFGLDFKRSFIYHILQIIVLTCSLIACTYIIYGRIIYFIEKPIAVDVQLNTEASVNLPLITVCSQDTQKIKDWKGLFTVEEDLMADINMNEANAFRFLMERLHLNITIEDLWNATNTSANVIDAKLYWKKEVKDIILKPRLHPFGLCNELHTDLDTLNSDDRAKIKFSIRRIEDFTLFNLVMGDIRSQEYPWDARTAWITTSGAIGKLIINIKKYKFLNRKNAMCSSHTKFEVCSKNCLKRAYALDNITCRFPFDLKSINMSLCKFKSLSNYTSSARLFFKFDPVAKCGCVKSCDRTVFDYSQQIFQLHKNDSSFTKMEFQINSDEIIYVSEREFYDEYAFVSDIGANFGLFLGLSLLSVFKFLHNFYIMTFAKTKYRNFTSNYKTLAKKVSVRCKYMKQKMKFSETGSFEEVAWPRKVLYFGQILFCIIIALIPTIFGLQQYLQCTIRTTISVVENKTIQIPSLIICSDGILIDKWKKNSHQCGKTIKQILFSHNIGNISLEKFWMKTKFGDIVPPNIKEIANNTLFNICIPYEMRSVVTMSGLCNEFLFEPYPYSGTHSPAIIFILKYKICQDETDSTIMLNNKLIPLLNTDELPGPGKVNVKLTIKEIHRLNLSQNPCTSSSLADKCLSRCVDESLLSNISCRLPYWNLTSELRLCESQEEIRYVYNTYLKTLTTAIAKKCKCLPSCHEKIYDLKISTEPFKPATKLFRPTIIGIYVGHNFIEHFNEVYNYPLVEYLIDVSSIIGLVLGVSVLSVVDNFSKFLRSLKAT